jgi:hypothetical protein
MTLVSVGILILVAAIQDNSSGPSLENRWQDPSINHRCSVMDHSFVV